MVPSTVTRSRVLSVVPNDNRKGCAERPLRCAHVHDRYLPELPAGTLMLPNTNRSSEVLGAAGIVVVGAAVMAGGAVVVPGGAEEPEVVYPQAAAKNVTAEGSTKTLLYWPLAPAFFVLSVTAKGAPVARVMRSRRTRWSSG